MHFIFKTVKNYSKILISFNNIYKCSVRVLSGEHVTVLNEKTLTGRILLYLYNNREVATKNTLTIAPDLMLNNLTNDNLYKMSVDEIINALHSINCSNKRDFPKFLSILDTECCLRLDNLSHKDTLKILNTCMNIISNHIIELKFYQASIEKLYRSINGLDKNDFLQLIFYIGLQKKKLKAQIMLRKCLKIMEKSFIDNLAIEELCIICNSTFKTSTKISNKSLLEKVKQYLNDNLFLLKDPALFITLIKTLRHNRYQDEDLLSTISCAIFFNKAINSYLFTTLCHILALFSDYFYYDHNLLNVFTSNCLQELRESKYLSKDAYLVEQPRIKDIKRLLWALSNLNYQISKTDLDEVVIPKIVERMQAGEFKKDPDSLVDILLYLWMMNYRALELVPHALTQENVQTIRSKKSPTKERLNLLLYCIYFEDRELYQKLNLKPVGQSRFNVNYQLERRPVLKRVLENLKSMTQQLEINRFEATYEIPFLNIVGITGYKKKIYKAVYIEVLDDYTCLKNTACSPTGLMALKLRLLDRSEDALIVISHEEIESLTEMELQEYLLDEIHLVC